MSIYNCFLKITNVRTSPARKYMTVLTSPKVDKVPRTQFIVVSELEPSYLNIVIKHILGLCTASNTVITYWKFGRRRKPVTGQVRHVKQMYTAERSRVCPNFARLPLYSVSYLGPKTNHPSFTCADNKLKQMKKIDVQLDLQWQGSEVSLKWFLFICLYWKHDLHSS